VATDEVLPELEKSMGMPFDRVDVERLSPLQREVLLEKQLITENLIKSPQYRATYVSDDRCISIMVNEEDHLRIQCWAPGLNLDLPMSTAFTLDDLIEAQLDMAFDEKMGYLTSCPTNLGTGLRASVLLHLPGLVFTRNVSSIINISPQLGLAVRALYGDDKEPEGSLFQISNQLTLGFSEEELIANLKSAVTEIVAHERRARKALALYRKEQLADEVWRAYGTLAYARMLSEREAMELLSKVRLGIDLKLIHEVKADCYADILVACHRSFLQNLAENENMSKIEIDQLRARKVREILSGHRLSSEDEV
jgi:protein arginine kinase